MTLDELNRHIITSLTPSLGAGEAKATARLMLEDVLKLSPEKLVMTGDRELIPETEQMFDRYLARIIAGEPPQYVIGTARFMGMDLKVTPAVLIPRPETAELVDIITDREGGHTDLNVIDIGTGSGCIAIALSRALRFPHIEAIDISDAALAVARENARSLMADIDFLHLDILAPAHKAFDPYNVIVSNPPYIAESEKSSMEARVKDHEPASALFVPDSDPLEFYKAIADFATENLAPNGTLYLEINPLFAAQLARMLSNKGFTCEIRLDSAGKKRFAIATRYKQ